MPGGATDEPATLSPPTATARPVTTPPLLPVHTQMHTLTHSHTPTTRTAGLTPTLSKGNREFGPWGPSPGRGPRRVGGTLTGKDRSPHATGPWPRPSRESQKGRRLGQGWAPGGLAASRPLPESRGGSYDLETDLELSRGTLGPFSQPGLQWPSCLQCHECIVSFIHFKYKQNKNHIFFRQQQFSR